ncbi:TonB-dependent receptor [Occallatibacter savannae]|uniref:TonB-dependent receptor n=1 Tax=Occallatibacter savannae TaxID=1002691 RepID=UPI0013A55874|nr:carboxypeptidase regulatory-like domain-containing protein [Occallatibacter savannae]
MMKSSPTIACLLLLFSSLLPAQTAKSDRTLHGVVQDQSGAVIPGATVVLRAQNSNEAGRTTTDEHGSFSLPELAPCNCQIEVAKEGFRTMLVPIRPSSARQPLHIVLPVAAVAEDVTVAADTSAQLSTEIGQNQSGNVMDTNALDRIPLFDQDYITTMSRFLDADSTGTSGTSLVVNGVEANGPGVTASAIQSVKINQNPYTALYSRPGRARIEIVTKGGTPQFHGSATFLYRDSLFDASNAFAQTRPSEQRTYLEGSVTGPLSHSKKTTFLASLDTDKDDQQEIVVAETPNGLINQNVPYPKNHYFLSGRVFHDYAQSNQFWIGYSYEHATTRNEEVGGNVLPEAGTNTLFFEHEINVGHVYVPSSKLVNALHFLVGHYDRQTHSITNAPQIEVSGAFTGGGAQADERRTEYHFDGTDIVTYTSGKHEIKFGIDVPDISRRGFDDWTNQLGTYSFADLNAYAASQPFLYITQRGEGHVDFLEKTFAGIFEDTIRPRSNLSLSLGVRYYWQNYFHDIPYNFAPRFGFAVAPRAKGRTVIRGGAGVFFDRTGPTPIADLLHFNGVRLKRFIVDSPTYPVQPAQLASVPTSIVTLDPNQRIPYSLQYGIGIEQQLNAATSVFVNYVGMRGIDRFRSRDVNAPPPPDYAARPNPAIGQDRQIESEGYLKSNALELGFRGRPTKFLTGQARYNLGKTYNDSGWIGGFPANSYAPNADWSRSYNDQRHKFDMLASLEAGKWFNFGTALSIYSGKPVNITTGRDDNHDGLTIDRPVGVPRNIMHGPSFIGFDLNAGHDFALTREGKKGPVASLTVNAFNVLNHPNYTTYVGVAGSPFFGRPIQAEPPRRMQLNLEFKF